MFVVEARQKPDAEELSLDDPRQPKLELRWPEQSRQEPSCIWFFDQACCEFVENPPMVAIHMVTLEAAGTLTWTRLSLFYRAALIGASLS